MRWKALIDNQNLQISQVQRKKIYSETYIFPQLIPFFSNLSMIPP
jgi:hypothetical protein